MTEAKLPQRDIQRTCSWSASMPDSNCGLVRIVAVAWEMLHVTNSGEQAWLSADACMLCPGGSPVVSGAETGQHIRCLHALTMHDAKQPGLGMPYASPSRMP